MPADPAQPDNLLLTVQEVARRLACSTRHVWRLVDAGQFPSPISLGTRLKRWPRAQVDRWLAQLSETTD